MRRPGFVRGLVAPFRGAKLVYGEPRLARYWGVPVVVTFACLLASLGAVFAWHDDVTNALWPSPAELDGWLGALARVAHDLVQLVITLFLIAAAILATMLIASTVAAPFNARLAEVLDERITGHPPPATTAARVVFDVLRVMAIDIAFFVVNLVLFVVGMLVSPLAPVLWGLGFVLTAYYFAIAYLEMPLGLRGLPMSARVGIVLRHPLSTLGFGTTLACVLFVPIVNVLLMPAAVAGAVLLYAELEGT